MITATLACPRRTAVRPSSAVGVVSFRFRSAWAPATRPREIALASWSTIATAIRAGSLLGPEKIDPKNDAIAIGTAKLMITARRSLKKSCRSLRIMARSGTRIISRAIPVPSA